MFLSLLLIIMYFLNFILPLVLSRIFSPRQSSCTTSLRNDYMCSITHNWNSHLNIQLSAITAQKLSTPHALLLQLCRLRNQQYLFHLHLPLYCGIIDLVTLSHILFLLYSINVISFILIKFPLLSVLLVAWEKFISPYSRIQHPPTPNP